MGRACGEHDATKTIGGPVAVHGSLTVEQAAGLEGGEDLVCHGR